MFAALSVLSRRKPASSVITAPSSALAFSSSSSQHKSMASTTKSTPFIDNPLTVHSTFRDELGRRVLPHGLEWHMAGDSYVSYAPSSPTCAIQLREEAQRHDNDLHKSGLVKRWIVNAHNKWSFAKDLPFRKVEDIANIQWRSSKPNKGAEIIGETPQPECVDNVDGNHHLHVEWNNNTLNTDEKEQRYTIAQIDGLLKMDKSAKGEEPPAEVWINGQFVSMLQPDTLEAALLALEQIPSRKLVFRKHRGIIRIERRFAGMIGGQEVFEHVLDNLYALEDVELLDNVSNTDTTTTIIGTATLPDWIMGGELTSRLWIQLDSKNGNIKCLRPLYHDNLNTTDRRFELMRGKHDDKIRVIEKEMERLRFSATALPAPFYGEGLAKEQQLESNDGSDTDSVINVHHHEKKGKTPREIQHKRNRRKFFGM